MDKANQGKNLRDMLVQFNSETGAIHRLDASTQLLHLVTQAGLPPQMLDIARLIGPHLS